jgi:hypothetical protein
MFETPLSLAFAQRFSEILNISVKFLTGHGLAPDIAIMSFHNFHQVISADAGVVEFFNGFKQGLTADFSEFHVGIYALVYYFVILTPKVTAVKTEKHQQNQALAQRSNQKSTSVSHVNPRHSVSPSLA